MLSKWQSVLQHKSNSSQIAAINFIVNVPGMPATYCYINFAEIKNYFGFKISLKLKES